MGRSTTDPVLLHPFLSPLAFQSEYLAKWKSEFSARLTDSSASEPKAEQASAAIPLLASTAAQSGQADVQAESIVSESDLMQMSVNVTRTMAVAAAPAAEAVQAAANAQTITTTTGDVITPKQTMDVVASAYTASAEENGGYAGKDYYGNPLQVGTIAVDPKMIPLGSTVYVTGYNFDGLPVGGMMGKATDIGGSIKGNRIDIFVPSSREKAKKFGYQNVTVHVVD